MSAHLQHDLSEIARHFAVPGAFLGAAAYGKGHINDTYLATYQTGQGVQRLVHQHINRQVFHHPEQVMENIARVTQYAAVQIRAAGGDPARETLNLVAAVDGGCFYSSPDGEIWRTYAFIEGAYSCEVAENNQQAYEAAKAFGNFQKLLNRLPGPRLHETIPHFHDTPRRFAAFEAACAADRLRRAEKVRAEIDFLRARVADTTVIVEGMARGDIPERVTHNDTKLNNVLLDDQTGKALCVVDLDTMMPGSVLYDFGDLLRMGIATAAEDEPNLNKVGIDLERFEALARGYLEAAGDFLTPAERALLVFAGRLITYEQAMRFFTDYLNGDVYYKTAYPRHNLVRARAQIKILQEMERQQAAMQILLDRGG